MKVAIEMSEPGVIRLEPEGPLGIGLTVLDLAPEDFQSALPKQNWHKFSQGDVFFVPEGTICSWKAGVPIRKFYCTLTTNE